MTKLLVVDDMAIFREPIAASLRRDGYDTACASNGKEALDLICGNRPDLILLDIAMPVMDGLSFLEVIRKQPDLCDIPVIMLTAMSERETLAQALRIGVQGYLLKSQFSLDDLANRVRKTLDSRVDAPPKVQAPAASGTAEQAVAEDAPKPLSETETLERIRRDEQLRAVPTVLHHVLALTESNRSSFADVAGAVRKDHALALKVMRVANSAFFGAGKNAETLADAGKRIGMSGVRNAVASVLVIEHFGSVSAKGLTPQRFWEHSLATAAYAELIGSAVGLRDVEHMFLAGLLHDVGRLVLGSVFPDHYGWALQSGAERNTDLVGIEREMFGVGHDDVTKELLTQWQTPESIREAASAHELSVPQIKRTTSDAQSALVIALANRLAHASVLGASGNSMLLPFSELAKALAFNVESIRGIVSEAAAKIRDTETFYASRTDQQFRVPLAQELSQQVEGEVKVKVFAAGSPDDPLSLFCEQLGWSASRKPNCAILSSSSERGLGTRFNQLLEYEKAIGARLAVLIASPDGSMTPPPGLMEGRNWATARIPGRYAPLIDAIAQLCLKPATRLVTS